MNHNNLNRMFQAAKILAPEGISVYENPCREIENERLKELVRRKAEHLDFIEKYGDVYKHPQPPFTMRLVYNGTCDRQFVASNRTELVFNLFDCCQQLLDDYAIRDEPESIEWHVYRTPYRHPKAESRVHPVYYDPGAGTWVAIMSFKIQEETPFFSFEELELAHEELWRWVPEYARRKMNPCGEVPLVEQKLGSFLPMK